MHCHNPVFFCLEMDHRAQCKRRLHRVLSDLTTHELVQVIIRLKGVMVVSM